MRATFTTKQIEAQINDWAVKNEQQFIQVLSYLGEEVVNMARLNNTYKDQTGNLRASIGYVISQRGNIVKKNYTGTALGKSKGQILAERVASEHSKEIVLIITAGMTYALYVEAMGYDVLTGSIPNKSEVVNKLYQLIK